MKKAKGYEYELFIISLEPGKKGSRTKSIGLSSNVSFSSDDGLGFCDLGFCNIRFKGAFKPEVARMPTQDNVIIA